MKWFLCFAACALLTGCNSAIRQAKEAVRQQLKDPDSAEFRNVRICAGDIVQGQVNSRNAYGGYAGYSDFITEGSEAHIFDASEVSSADGYDKLLDKCTAMINATLPPN